MKNEFFFPSSDGVTQIHAIEWIPEEVKGIVQIVHGMLEHINRYHDFAEYLNSKGYYVVGHDHLGHGKSVASPERKTFFNEKNGNACLIADIHQLRVLTTEKYPDVPYYILGHSMGSFLTRQYHGVHGEGLAGVILSGTGDQPYEKLHLGKITCKVFATFKGWFYRSKFIDNASAGSYSKKFERLNDGTSWISKDVNVVKAYKEDPYRGPLFTLNAYYNMYEGILKMKKLEDAAAMPKDIPVFFVAGSEDPVGNNGKAVEKVYKQYLNCGVKNVQMKIYEGDRHEILNELDKDVVYEDIMNFLSLN